MTTAAKLQDDLDLKYLVKPAAATAGKKKALILLHGVGSNEQDLFSLAPLLPDNLLVISPRGPVTLGEGRYAWYQVDFSSGAPVINAQQEEQSRGLILDFVRQVKQQYAVEEVYLGGFSQGAIMSFSIGLTRPKEISGVLSFSGRVLMEIRPYVEQGEDLKQLAVFIAHGTQDNTLPVHYAREAKAYLQQLGVKLSYHEFEMGHQISNPVLEETINWLNAK
jgi:phospholipase/carboxylesterase